MEKVNMWIATVEVQKAVDSCRACQRRTDKKEQLVSPVSSVCFWSALCLCCTLSVFDGSSCPVSGKTHVG